MNTTTAAQFFARFPELHRFLLGELGRAVGQTMALPGGTAGPHSTDPYMSPSLYPILLLLSRLSPTYTATTAAALSVSAFLPFLQDLAGVRHSMARMMAARALASLVPVDSAAAVARDTLARLPTDADPAALRALPLNTLDGTLQQACALLGSVRQTPGAATGAPSLDAVIGARLWLIEAVAQGRLCGYVREKALRLFSVVGELGLCPRATVCGDTLALRRLDSHRGLARLSLPVDAGVVMELTLCAAVATRSLFDACVGGCAHALEALRDVAQHSLFPVRAASAKQAKRSIRAMVGAGTCSGACV